MTLIGLVDDKGEFTEVQVLEEGEVFDPDEFLDQLEKNQPPQCSRHMVPLKCVSHATMEVPSSITNVPQKDFTPSAM